MNRVLAIARLTFWEGIRMRIVLVFIIVLVFLVLRLPFALRGDETLAGRLQTFLDYSLGALSVLLSFATVFFSCSTLATEMKNYTIHLVVTKPVTRFQILLGKWLGVNLLNVLLLTLCGLAIYAFASFIKNRPEQFARDRMKVRDIVWTARAAADPIPPDFTELAKADVEQRMKDGALRPEQRDAALTEKKSDYEIRWRKVGPGTFTVYTFDHLPPPNHEDEVVQVRFKARGIPLPREETLHAEWMFLDPATGEDMMPSPLPTAERSGDMHQFLVRAKAVKDGKAALAVINPPDEQGTSINFEGKNSLQILYKVGSFERNFVLTLAMILFRLAFLSAVGLLFSVFVSFPIACLATFATYIIGLGRPWWVDAIGGNIEMWTATADPYGKWGPLIRVFLMPILKVCFPDFTNLDGTAHLVDGLYIPESLVGWAALHTLAFGVVLLFGVGWLVFRRREIAEVTVNG